MAQTQKPRYCKEITCFHWLRSDSSGGRLEGLWGPMLAASPGIRAALRPFPQFLQHGAGHVTLGSCGGRGLAAADGCCVHGAPSEGLKKHKRRRVRFPQCSCFGWKHADSSLGEKESEQYSHAMAIPTLPFHDGFDNCHIWHFPTFCLAFYVTLNEWSSVFLNFRQPMKATWKNPVLLQK